MILQCAIIFLFLALGELIVYITKIPVPSSIIGMLLLTFALSRNIVKPSQIERVCNFLLKNLGFFFVPAGIGLMKCLGLLREQWFPIVAATVLSTFAVLFVTGHSLQLTRHIPSLFKRHELSDK